MPEKERLGHLKEGQEPVKWAHGRNLNSSGVIDSLENLKMLLEQQVNISKKQLAEYQESIKKVSK